jgi:hypothetical protein
VTVLNVRPPRPAVHQQTYAGHEHILMHVQTRATRMQYFHGSLLAAVGVEPPLMNSNKRAPGRITALGAVGGAQGLRVQLENGLIRTKETTDLGADDTSQHTTSFIRGGSAVVGAN